jgi:hypothetical protein
MALDKIRLIDDVGASSCCGGGGGGGGGSGGSRKQTNSLQSLLAGEYVGSVGDGSATLLHFAAWCGHTELVGVLLDASADVNQGTARYVSIRCEHRSTREIPIDMPSLCPTHVRMCSPIRDRAQPFIATD